MTKSRKPAKTQTPSRFTNPEVDAALQLIHLSGGEDSSSSNNNNNNNNNRSLEAKGEEEIAENHDEICSGMTVEDGNLDDEDFPPKNRKFRSLVDIYSKTKPILPNKPAAAGKKIKITRKDTMAR